MPSGNAPLTSYLSQGTLSNYEPSWRDKAAYWLAQNWYGDNREGVQKANRLMNVADVTPVGIPLAFDDAARSFGHGNYAGGAVTLAMAGIPAVRKEAKLSGDAAKKTLDAILEKHGLTPPIKAYHNSPYDFEQFDPSKSHRGASFFARTPDTAKAGASAGAGDTYGTRGGTGKNLMYEVEIQPGRIVGLDLTPSEQEWFKSLPNTATEDQINDIQKSLKGTNFDYWWRLYDEKPNSDGTFTYVKTAMPSVSYEDAAKTNRDVYGRQFAHYGTQTSERDVAEKVKAKGMAGYAIQDEAGLSLAVADPRIVKILQKHDLLPKPPPKTIRAYHGSPHSFDQFSMDKIGTGEGAQAYGHGLYFAENEGVAKNYRDALAGAGKVVTNRGAFDTQKKLARIAKKYGDDLADEVKESLRMVTTGEMSLDDAKSYWLGEATRSGYGQDVYASIFRDAKHLKNTGHMYEVSINADPEQFLDWDKPLSEQGEKVRGAVKYAFGNVPDNSKFGDYNLPTVPGPSQTRLLKDKGVAGIKYLDAGSRGKGDGSRNYVVFDERLIQILRKYGLLPAMLGGGAAFGSLSPQDQSQ